MESKTMEREAIPFRPARHFAALLILAAVTATVSAQTPTGIGAAVGQADLYLKGIGDQTGSLFSARCGIGELLTGVELRAGDDIDAIRPLCVTAYGPRETTSARLTTGSGLTTQNRSMPFGLEIPVQVVESGWHGGSGGTLVNLLCPGGQPIVTGITVRIEGVDTITVNNIHLFCGEAAAVQNYSSRVPTVRFDAPQLGQPEWFDQKTQHCPVGQVAVGIHGRSGIWLDALGLICGEPRLTPKPVKPTGRIKLPGAQPSARSKSICELARQARARNSPAAPGLEAQCTAQGPAGELKPAEPREPVKAVGRVKLPGAQPSARSKSICELARQARARNSPAAPGLEAQCAAQGPAGELKPGELNALAAKGPAIASQDPLATELRNLQPEGPARRGFDIGLAAAEGHTAWGPGKQRIQDALGPGEQAGFTTAVSFSLGRNRQKLTALAPRGAEIASQDPLAAALRLQQPDPARIGFDIGMAAAEGHTAPDASQERIRNSLPPAEQVGFDAAVSFALQRNRYADLAARGADVAEADPRVADVREFDRRSEETDSFFRLGFDIATGVFADPESGPGSLLAIRDLTAPAKLGFDASVELHLSGKLSPK